MSAGILVLMLQAAVAAGYVQVVVDGAPITAGRGRGPLIGHAPRGTIVESVGESGGYYAIRLFSGRSRYVRKSSARPVAYNPKAPLEPAVRLQLISALNAAQLRAEREAPPRSAGRSQQDASRERRAVLRDQYQLHVMASFQLNPPVYSLLPELAGAGR